MGNPDAERIGRDALAAYASALNWAEDTHEFEPIHRAMDAAGRWVRQAFGCELEQKNAGYFRTCPVDLAHRRIGLSIEFVAKTVVCSICGSPIEACDHIAGRIYDGQRCGRIIEDIDRLLGIALVSRPAQPDARLTSVSVGEEQLRRALPAEWEPGMPVSCDLCIKPCRGIEEVDFSSGGSSHYRLV